MCCKSFWKTILPFATAFLLGVLLANQFQKNNNNKEHQPELKPAETKINSGSGQSGMDSGRGTGIGISTSVEANKVFLISKPRPNYTVAARENDIQGKVRLLITFLESGQIGDVSPINELPHGLTEEAIEAAKNIKFRPATVNGKSVTVRKTIEYSFTIY